MRSLLIFIFLIVSISKINANDTTPVKNNIEAGGPTVIITQAPSQTDPTNSTSVVFRATFSEAVTNFEGTDVVTSASTVTGTLSATLNAVNASTYDITISGITGNGTVIISIPADVCNASGPPGKLNQASTNTDNTITFENTPPAAFTTGSVVTTGGTIVSGRWNASNTGVDVTVPIDNDGSLTGGTVQLQARISSGSFANLGSAASIVIGDLNSNKTISITDTQLQAIAGYAEGVTIQFRAIIKDLAGNSTTGTQSATSLIVDETAPSSFTVGSIVTTGGTVKAGFWNATNTGIDVTVPIANDASLNGGNVQIQAKLASAGSFENVGAASSISAVSTNKVVALTAAEFEGITGFADGETIQVRAIITDIAGNTTTGNQSATTIAIDQTSPNSFTVGAINTTGGTVVAGYWNSTNTGVSITVPVANDATLTNGTIQVQARVSSGTFANVGSATTILVGDLNGNKAVSITKAQLEAIASFAESSTIEFRSVITDVAGNSTTGGTSATTLFVDRVAPSAASISTLQASPVYGSTVTYTVVFTNGPIDPATFAGTDFNVSGGTATYTMGTPTTANNITWDVVATVSSPGGTVQPTLNLNTVRDIAGNTSGSINSNTPAEVEVITEPTSNGTIAASNVTTSALRITRTGGNGERYILVGRQGSPVSWAPTDGTNYNSSENLNFSASAALDADGNKILADASSATTTYDITGLLDAQTYHFAIFGYNQGSTSTLNNFAVTANTTSQVTNTCTNPTAPVFTSATSNTGEVTLNFSRSDGNDAFIILFRVNDGSPLTAPTNGVDYTSIDDLDFASAGALGNAFVVYSGDPNNNLASSRTITNLDPGVTYAYAIYTYNSTTFCYQPTAITGTIATTTTYAAELTITAGALVEPATISPMSTALSGASAPQVNAVANFDFTITDAQGNNDGTGSDGSKARISQIVINAGSNNEITDWSQVIASARISDGTNNQNASSIGTNSITFSAIPNGTGNLGEVLNDRTKTYTLTVVFRTTLLGTWQTTIDGKQFDFNVTTASITTGVGSTMAAAQTLSSGAAKNVVNVAASQINFTSIPANGTQAGTPFSISISATDANGNLDLSETGTGSTMRLAGVYSGSGGVLTFGTSQDIDLNAGVGTWTGLKVSKGGNWYFTVDDQDTAPTDLTPSLAQSSTVNFANPSAESTVDVNTLFSYPSDIDYRSFQRSSTTPGAPGSDVIKVAEFIIKDGGLDLIDADQIGTTLTDISFSVTNPGNLRLLGIYDGSTIVSYQTAAATTTFSGLNILAEDIDNSGTGQKTIALYASFKANVTDNQNFSFQVSNVGTANGGSTFALANGGGALTANAPLINNVVVTASEVRFVQGPTNTYLNNAMSPTVTVETTDNLGSRDLDYNTPGGPGGAVNISSTGTMSPNLVLAPISSGFGTVTTSIVHTVTGTGLKLNAFVGQDPGITGQSQGFDILADNKSDIIYEIGSAPTNIFYANHQDATISAVGTGNVQVAQFRIRDGGSSGTDLDAAPTVLNDITFAVTGATNIKRVAIFNGSTLLAEKPAAASVNFTGFNLSTIADGSSAILTVRVSFNSTVTDNAQIGFQITSASTTTSSSSFAAANAGGASSPNSPNNLIEVVASKYFFTTPVQGSLANTVLAEVNLTSAPGSGGLGSNVRLEARDANNNLDSDYSTSVTVTNAGSIPMSDGAGNNSVTSINYSFNAGVLQFPNDFRYRNTGNGTLHINGGSITITSLTTPQSPPITVTSSSASDIVEDLSGTFTSYNQNIEYVKYPASNANISPANPSNPNPSTDDEIKVAQFKIRDGGGSNDLDNASTELTGITFTITNYQYISRLALYDGNIELGEVALNGGSSTAVFTFNPLVTAIAPDNGSKILSLFATFTNNVVDNTKISFQITSVTANPLTSTFASANGGGATTPNNPLNDDNRLEVIATQINFTTPATNSVVSLNSPFAVSVRAIDVNSNIDLDFEGAPKNITSLTNATSATMESNPVVVGQQFTDGVYNFPNDFRYTSGNNNDNVTLTINAGGISGVSPTLTLQASLESSIVGDPTFNFTQNIPYENFPESTDLTDANSFLLARALLVDGSRSNFSYSSGTLTTNTDTDGNLNQDIDGAKTTLNDITIRVTNPANIRRIALFTNNGTQIGSEIAVNEATNVASKDFTFSGSPLLAADDDSQSEIRVRVSFWNDAAHITDNQLIRVSVISATLGAGSKFFNSPPFIAGVNGGLSAPTSVNLIEVTATSLDFVQQPSAYAGINEPITGQTGTSPGGSTGIVHARDKNAVVDLDFNFPVSVSAPAIPTGYPANFTAGILNLAGMIYKQGGVGTLTVTANSLSSDNEPWTSSAKCNTVDVIHVTASLPQNPNNGVVTSPSLKGGTSNIVIFGFDIYPDYSTSAEPDLQTFSIKFSKPYKTSTSTIFKNFKVFESTAGTFVGSTNVTALNGTVTEAQSDSLINAGASVSIKDLVTVTFPAGSYRSLKNRLKNNPITYFLVADIDATANLSTPKLRPQLIDGGFSSPTTNNNIATSIGSSESQVLGTLFGFASTRPPSLIASIPANGSLNVDPNLSSIKLYFDVGVWSHDEYILLWDRYSNTLVDTLKLTGSNGFYPGPVTKPLDSPPIPLTFTIPDPTKLKADSVYYVTIAKGTFDNNTKKGTGISDDVLNLYGGISYNGGLYFKIASNKPPVMLSTDKDKYYESATGATINASFDQKEGKAYFMIVNQGGPAPTNAQIKGTDNTYAGVVQARGQMSIDQVNPNLTAGTFTVVPSASPRTFDVWIYAENGAPTPVATTAPYGKFNEDANNTNDFVVGATGPTYTITIPAATNQVYLNRPIYQICANSTATLVDPIIIEESTARNEFSGSLVTAGNFNLGSIYVIKSVGTTNFTLIGAANNNVGTVFTATGVGAGTGTATLVQTFNVLLPTGFTFDTKTVPLIQTSGGVDFVGGTAYQYVNSTILRIGFANNGSTSQDKLVISNLKVIASAADLSGTIERFAGNAFPNASNKLGDGTVLARIVSSSATALNFNNSYTTSNNFDAAPINIANAVTAIPDNYVDPDVNLGPFTVRLLPQVPKGDYGASSFSGNGVTNDILNLTAVSLNTAFDITMTHTDMNGCVSNKVVQYEVYDHTEAIPALVDAVYGTKDFITNPNYLTNQPPPTFSPSASTEFINRDFKAGYSLIELFANIPSNATPFDSVDVKNNTLTSQIMYGPAWQNLVKQIPIKKDSSDFNATLGEYYRSYYWYYGSLLPLDPNLDPYRYFDGFTQENRKFYRGGSIGIVEFTGKFRSTADATVLTPIRQEIEVFIPAIPVVEIASSAITGYDPNDPLKSDVKLWPQGTPIFCQNGTPFTITGYPLAVPGESTGFFDIVDAANSLDTLYSSKSPSKRYGGFTDNLNGTAVLDPQLLKNAAGKFANDYKSVRIIYTYKDNDSPIAGSGDLVIRITPNPKAVFATSNLCEDVNIQFTDQSVLIDKNGNTITADRVSIDRWSWDFGDLGSTDNLSTIANPIKVYSQPQGYTASLTATTNFGCVSPTVNGTSSRVLQIGGTPEVSFTFVGVSTDDDIVYTSNSTVVNDVIATQDWTFGDGNIGSGASASNKFGTPGIYKSILKVTSQKGCVNSDTTEVVILPRAVVTDANVYAKDFEVDNAGWQFFPSNSTWQWTTASKSVIKNDASLNGQKVWITNNTGIYDRESFLYTAAYDISALDRPMISFSSFVQMDNGDGVVLEYSTDNKNASDPTKVWKRLGTNTSGVNWYNGQGLPSNPGNQVGGDYGWAGVRTNGNINNWQESKHSLSEVPAADKGKVVFRFALASVSLRTTDGFALDNVRIGNRTRTILVENFTNKGTNNPFEVQESNYLKSFIGSVGTEIVKINYHVAFPGTDPLNQLNQADPSGRALFYNVVKTPFAFLDGQNENPDEYFSQWAQSKYDSQSLTLAGADLVITSALNSSTGTYSVSVNVTARKQLPNSAVLHVGFLEQTISNITGIATGETSFEYVLKKLLPSASGTRFNQALNTNSSRTFGPFEWTPDSKKLFTPANDLVLVVFVQDEITKEVYQSELIAGLSDPPVITGIKDLLPEQVNAYPNPAKREFKVELPAVTQSDVALILIDQVGRIHECGKISSGNNSATVNVEHLAEGIYILQIGNDASGVIRKKMMIVQGN